MPYDHDYKPHWAIRFVKPSRYKKSPIFLLQCVLYHSAHQKAPLAKYVMLCDIRSDKLEDEDTRRWFWGVIYRELDKLSGLIDPKYRAKLCAQIARRVPEPISIEKEASSLATRPTPPRAVSPSRGPRWNPPKGEGQA